jgi:allantoin racemase
MDILVLNPFGQTEPNARENLERVARDEVNLTIENISEVFPLDYNTYRYNNLKCANGAVEHVVAAEEEGYDGVVLSCQAEPGIHDMRSVVDIPVVGTMEASCQLATSMGRRFSVVVTDRIAAEYERDVIESHGYDDRLASFRWIGIHACDLYPKKTDPKVVQERSIDRAQKAITDDHAEVLISGCTVISAILTSTAGDLLEREIEVPIVDAMDAGLKVCEMMVDLQQKAGYKAVSRIGRYRRPPKQEFDQLRQWMRSHNSPEQHYIEQRDLEYDSLAGSFVTDEEPEEVLSDQD